MTQPTVFISYSHKDEKEKDYLLTHLGVLQQAGLLDLWNDDRISAGGDWEAEIGQAMGRAKVAILLITANFLNSNFILQQEVPRLLERRKTEGVVVFPVIARACAWRKVTWLSAMNVRPKNGNPVWGDGGSHVDEDLAVIAEEVAAIIEKAAPSPPPAQPQPPLLPNEPTPPPVQVIHWLPFGKLPQPCPPEVKVIDWRNEFDFNVTPRKIPGPAIWQEKLWPELKGLAQNIADHTLIRLNDTPALSAGFAFGHIFTERRYQLEVVQPAREAGRQWWRSNEKPKTDTSPEFVSHILPGNPTAAEAVVIVFAVNKRPCSTVVQEIGAYLGEAEAWQGWLTEPEAQVNYNLPTLRQFLIDGFNDEELRTLAYDNPKFRPVYERLAGSTGKTAIVQQLVEFTEKQLLFEELFALLEQQNPRRYARYQADFKQITSRSQKFSGVLLLEAETTLPAQHIVSGGEAAALARSSSRLLAKFLTPLKRPPLLNLFLVVPAGLAVFLGHQWNAVGVKVQCYEWAGVSGQYLPSWLKDL